MYVISFLRNKIIPGLKQTSLRHLITVVFLYIPNLLIVIYPVLFFISGKRIVSNEPEYFFYGYILAVSIINISAAVFHKRISIQRTRDIFAALSDFKKSKFLTKKKKYIIHDRLSTINRELGVIGTYIDGIITKLKDEIRMLRELYNNIIFSISSYLIILDRKREIIFANDIFCKKFQLDLDELIGKNIDDIFLFVTDNFKNSIEEIYGSKESIILEKTHLLTKNWISIIADIKITKMTVQNEEQVVLIIDDITSKCRKDYQMNLISQVSGSIRSDEEIHRILYTILYGITSGAGLGFNRAMLFLLDQKKKYLIGEIAVGPDSIEEAIEIWNSMPNSGVDVVNITNTFDPSDRKGSKLLEKVMNAMFDVESDNLFSRSFRSKENIHIYDSWNDGSVDENIRQFMDVKEFVIVPLIVENRVIGIIVADNKYNQVPIGNEHIELLKIFAVQASLLIDSYYNVSTLKKEMDKIKNKQEAMIESEKLAAIGRISSHIAHEIRNPLVTMGGYAQRIMQYGENSEKTRHAADVILKESIRLENILSNVMDLTKPQAIIKNLNNINDIISDTIDLLRNVFSERKIHIHTNLYQRLPLVDSDSNQIKQVMLNLLQNALDATPENGEIEIDTGINTANKSIFITVCDTGSGINMENLDDIFEPFFTTKITGVGLGLAIVKRIIKEHHGEITVRNTERGGAEFTITLPYGG